MGSESLIAYVNGEYVPKDQARIFSIFDFGFLRGDEVFAAFRRRMRPR